MTYFYVLRAEQVNKVKAASRPDIEQAIDLSATHSPHLRLYVVVVEASALAAQMYQDTGYRLHTYKNTNISSSSSNNISISSSSNNKKYSGDIFPLRTIVSRKHTHKEEEEEKEEDYQPKTYGWEEPGNLHV